jgi:signal peptidase II
VYSLCLTIAAAIVVLDQITKWWVLTELADPPRVIPVTSFFTLVLAWNTGVSFSLFDGTVPPYVFAAVAAAIVVGLLIWLGRVHDRAVAIGIALIIGGAVGNVIDRLQYGAVVDFLYFHAGKFYWPAFNLADSAITIGVVILIVDSLFVQRRAVGESKLDGRK